MPEPRRATPHRPPGALLKAFLRPSRGQFAAGVALFLTALIVVVTLRSHEPLVWIACIETLASSPRMSGTSSTFTQLYWIFWRVVKWA